MGWAFTDDRTEVLLMMHDRSNGCRVELLPNKQVAAEGEENVLGPSVCVPSYCMKTVLSSQMKPSDKLAWRKTTSIACFRKDTYNYEKDFAASTQHPVVSRAGLY
ncbi:hypothetical protein SKAU_G00291560 [Synaphobranchus kaupii]|uniref:Uncharacterized protein n=1 Tax=Synaphobranchus kaupii TaxID=118154 RepID=A0A9Q1ETW4_SYNKA|nr:hypothetical protein SKAU_G00291560 [Synaphobranchus kaupii]